MRFDGPFEIINNNTHVKHVIKLLM
jgi:hypothetical protein